MISRKTVEISSQQHFNNMSADTKTRLRKIIDEDAIAENFDNTAPFKSIVASIEAKKGKERALSQYVNCVARRRAAPAHFFSFTDFLYPSQPRNLFSEEWDGGLNSGFFESLPYKSLMPWIITTAENIGKPDPVADLVYRRYQWNWKWSHYKKSYWLRKRKTYKWFGDDVLHCPKSFIEMAEHFENNPDPFFSAAYNWYYAGEGNLLLTYLDGSYLIAHSQFNSLNVSPFFKETMSIDYVNTATYKCSEESNILETTQSLHFIAIRTKCKIIILKLVTDEQPLKLVRLKEIDSELPFTSIRFDQFHKNILYVTTLDYKLNIVNLDRTAGRSVKLQGKFPTLVDNWNTVVAGERGNYAHVTKKAVSLYDKRTNEPFQRWKGFTYISDIQTCADISAVKYCNQKPLMYIATDHHLYLMDMRCGKTRTENIKPVQRWSHGMMSAPTYIDICTYDENYNTEIVCLASQWFEDMCLVNNYSDTLKRTGEIPGLSLPYRPPSLMETFNEAHRNKLCYSLYDQIHHRLCTAISGLAVLDQGDNHSILMQNSLGDISCHALYPKDMHAFIENDSIEKLHEWCKDYKEDKKAFEVSHIIDIRTFLKNLNRVPDDVVLGTNTIIKPRENFDEEEIRETFDKEKLDPEFMEAWKEKDDEITLDETAMSEFFVEA